MQEWCQLHGISVDALPYSNITLIVHFKTRHKVEKNTVIQTSLVWMMALYKDLFLQNNHNTLTTKNHHEVLQLHHSWSLFLLELRSQTEVTEGQQYNHNISSTKNHHDFLQLQHSWSWLFASHQQRFIMNFCSTPDHGIILVWQIKVIIMQHQRGFSHFRDLAILEVIEGQQDHNNSSTKNHYEFL